MQGKRGGGRGLALPAGEYTPVDGQCVAETSNDLHSKDKRRPEDRYAVCVDGAYDTFHNIAKCYREYPFRSLTKGACGSSEYTDRPADRGESVRARAARYGIPYEPINDTCFQHQVSSLTTNERRVPEDRFEVCVDGQYDTYDNIAKCYREYPNFESYAKGSCAKAAKAAPPAPPAMGMTPATFDHGVCSKMAGPNGCDGSVTYVVDGKTYEAGVGYVDVSGPRGNQVSLAIDRRTGACQNPCTWYTNDGRSGTFSRFEPRGAPARPPARPPVRPPARPKGAPKGAPKGGTPRGLRTRATYTPCKDSPGLGAGCNGADGVLQFTNPWKNSGRIAYVKNPDPSNAPPRNVMVYLLGPDPGIREATNTTYEWTAPGRRGTLVPAGGPRDRMGGGGSPAAAANLSADPSADFSADAVRPAKRKTNASVVIVPSSCPRTRDGAPCTAALVYDVDGARYSQTAGFDGRPAKPPSNVTIDVDPATGACGTPCTWTAPDGKTGTVRPRQAPDRLVQLKDVTVAQTGCAPYAPWTTGKQCTGTMTYTIGEKTFAKPVSQFRAKDEKQEVKVPSTVWMRDVNPATGDCGDNVCTFYTDKLQEIVLGPAALLTEEKRREERWAKRAPPPTATPKASAEHADVDAEYAGVETEYATSGWQPSDEPFWAGEAARRVFDDGFYPRPQSTSFVAPPPPSNRKRVWTGVKVDQDAVACKRGSGNCKGIEWTAGGAKKKEVARFDRPNTPFGTQIYVEFQDGGECGSSNLACGWYGPGGETGTLGFDRPAPSKWK